MFLIYLSLFLELLLYTTIVFIISSVLIFVMFYIAKFFSNSDLVSDFLLAWFFLAIILFSIPGLNLLVIFIIVISLLYHIFIGDWISFETENNIRNSIVIFLALTLSIVFIVTKGWEDTSDKIVKEKVNLFIKNINPDLKKEIDKIDSMFIEIDEKVKELKKLNETTSYVSNKSITKIIKSNYILKEKLLKKYQDIYLKMEATYVKNKISEIQNGRNFNRTSKELSSLVHGTLVDAKKTLKNLKKEVSEYE